MTNLTGRKVEVYSAEPYKDDAHLDGTGTIVTQGVKDGVEVFFVKNSHGIISATNIEFIKFLDAVESKEASVILEQRDSYREILQHLLEGLSQRHGVQASNMDNLITEAKGKFEKVKALK